MQDEDELITVQVARTEPAADGIQLFELRDPDGATLPPFTPGAHLAVRVPSGAMRNYSLSNDPADERDRYVIAVKREEQGRGGSVSMIETVRAGDTAAGLAAAQPVRAGRRTRRATSSSPAASASRRSCR